MAGIWDRLVGVDQNDDPVPSHRIKSAVFFKAMNVGTNQQLRDMLNKDLGTALSTAAETDIVNMANVVSALLTDGDRAYYMDKLTSLLYAIEDEVPEVTETLFRNKLGI